MRLLALIAVLASGCGPLPLAGNWRVQVFGTGGCSGTMAIRQAGADLDGAWACGALEGSVLGAVSGDSVSIRWSATGYRDMLITANASDHSMSGRINGSGYSGQPFSADRL